MTPAQRERADELFLRAVELPDEERTGFLDGNCNGDPEIRREVESLLCHDGGAAFLDTATPRLRAADFLKHHARLPERIGGYRVMRKIGQGGTATVYEAEQESTRRRVALKVVPAAHASRNLQRRFEREIQILGELKHPGIATIYDAGAASIAGVPAPYLAMELVNGLPITEFADKYGLGVRERLALVAEVCEALQVAHDHGIIHRDLKPGNILVPELADRDQTNPGTRRAADTHSSESQSPYSAKILDFGVARLVNSDVQMTLDGTNMMQLIGTVPYMSPEQVRGRNADLDIRTDVYSMGVVLYELLCGRVPLEVRDRSLAEAARIIQEEEPTKPSAINVILRGDVETLLEKCLAKDASRRFQSAADVAADIRRYLRNEPIRARPASTFYQLRKFAQRNRGLVATMILIGLSLTAATAISTYYSIREATQHAAADRAAHRANIVAAAAEIENFRPAQARALLDRESNLNRNTWEWKHLSSRLDSSDIRLQGHTGSIVALAFVQNGEQIISAARDNTIRTWSLATRSQTTIGTQPRQISKFAVNSSGTAAIAGTIDGAVIFWQLNSSGSSFTCESGDSVGDVAIAPDGTRAVALVRTPTGREIQLWDVPERKMLRCRNQAIGQATGSCAFNSRGDEVLLGIGTGIERLAAETLKRLDIHYGAHDVSAVDIAMTPDGAHVASCSPDKSIALWNGNTFEIENRLEKHTGAVTCVALSNDGNWLASGANDQTIRIWNVNSGELTFTLLGPTSTVRALTFSVDSRLLAAAGDDALIRVWDMARVMDGRSQGVLTGHRAAVYHVLTHPREDLIISAGWSDKKIRFWDPHTGECTRIINAPGDQQCIAIHPDGGLMASCAWNLRLIDLNSGEFRECGKLGGRARSVEFWPTHDHWVTTAITTPARPRGVLCTWDGQSGKQLTKTEYDGDILVTAAPQGLRLVMLSAGNCRVVDLATDREICRFSGHESKIERVRFSPDGMRFLTATQSGDVGVWDTSTGARLALLRGHQERAYDAMFLADGSRIASASNDNSIRIWDADTFEDLIELRGHERYVYSLALTRDGTLASASGDGQVRLWPAP